MKAKLAVTWAFTKWCFTKMFGGCFNKAEVFRHELKKGAPDSIFAVVAFVILSMISSALVLFVSVALIDDKHTIAVIAASVFWLVVFTFFYNVIKAAFESFESERQDIINRLQSNNT